MGKIPKENRPMKMSKEELADFYSKHSGKAELTDSPIDWGVMLATGFGQPLIKLGKNLAAKDGAEMVAGMYAKSIGYSLEGMPIIAGVIDKFLSPSVPNESIEEYNEEYEKQITKDPFKSVKPVMAMGGKVKNTSVEVEGGEMIQTPYGEVGEVQGASHERGGVDMNLPEGTQVFSDRIKIKGKTMAERKALRMKKLLSIIDNDSTSGIFKNSVKRTTEALLLEEETDLAFQEMLNESQQKLAYGTGPDGIRVYNRDPNVKSFFKRSLFPAEGKALGTVYPEGSPDQGVASYYYWRNQIDPYMQTDADLTVNPDLSQNIDYAGTLIGNSPKVDRNRFKASEVAIPDVDVTDSLTTTPTPFYPTLSDFSASDIPDVDLTKSLGKSPKIKTQTPKTPMNLGNFTTGDLVGIAGQTIGAFAQMGNTIANARATKPNVNHYEGFNENALKANQEAIDNIGYEKENILRDLGRKLAISRNSARNRARNSSSSISGLRANDLAIDLNVDEAMVDATTKAEGNYLSAKTNLLGQKSQLLSQRDQMVMAGRSQKDANDQADIDNFYTQFGANMAGLSTTAQSLGKNLNESKYRDLFLKILPQTNKYGIGIDENGKMFSPTKTSSKTYQPSNYQPSSFNPSDIMFSPLEEEEFNLG